MSQTESTPRVHRSLSAMLLAAALAVGCSGEGPPPTTLGPMPMGAEEAALKALKDKFYVDKNCAVYQKIVTFSCESNVVQVMCKDIAGVAQVDYYLRDPANATGWYSEKDVDAQIADIQARLNEAQMRKALFTPAHNPGYQCSPL